MSGKMTFVKRLNPRWFAEVAGLAAVSAGLWLLSPIVGLVAAGVALILEGSFGEPTQASNDERPE